MVIIIIAHFFDWANIALYTYRDRVREYYETEKFCLGKQK